MTLTEATRRRIAGEIEYRRALLTAEETWWQQQPNSDTRRQGFRAINFWRNVLLDAERRLSDVDVEAPITAVN